MSQSTEQALLLRLEASLRTFERQMERARGVGRQTARGIQGDFDGMNQRLATSSRQGAAALGGFVNVGKQGRAVLQNTAAQIGDIAVQLEQGTNVFRVFGQQVPQILGGFAALGGPLGVLLPLLSTVVAIGAPLAGFWWGQRQGAKEAAEEVDAFAKAISEAEGALKRMETALALSVTGSLSEVEALYGEVTDRVQNLIDSLAEIEIRAARVEVGEVLDIALGDDFRTEVDRLFGDVGAALVQAGTAEAQAQAEEIRRLIAETLSQIALIETGGGFAGGLRDQVVQLEAELAAVEGRFSDIGVLAQDLSVSPDALRDLQAMRDRLEAAQSAGDFRGVADAINDIRAALVASGQEIDQGVLDGLVAAESVARRFAAEMQDAEEAAEATGDAAAGISRGMAPAVRQAQDLARFFGISLERAARLARLGPQGLPGSGAPQVGGRGGDPRTMGGSFFDWQTRDAANWRATWRAPSGPSAGAGRGGADRAAEVAPHLQAMAEILREVQRETVTLEQVQAALTEQYQSGEIGVEDYGRAMELARERFSQTNREIEKMGDFLAELAVSWDNAGDVAVNALRRIAREMLSRAFTDGLNRLASRPGGGWVGTIASALFGGGKSSGTVEARPALSVAGRSGTIVPNEALAGRVTGLHGGAIANAQAQQVRLVVEVAEGEMFRPVIRAESQGVATQIVRQGIETYDRTLPDRMVAIQRDPRRRG
jgi:hypothetical protein